MTAYPSRDGISVVAKDITERQRTEQALQRLAGIVQSSDDAIISVTADGRVTSWNLGAERLYGYTAAETLGQQLGMLIPPHLEAERQGVHQQALAGHGIQGHETQRLRRDGTLVDVSLSVSPIRDSSGVIIGLSAIARDISEWRRAELGLQRQVQFDELMTRILTRFTTCLVQEVETSVVWALQLMAKFLGVDHAHVLIFSADQTTWSATHEWCGPSVGRQAQAFQNVPIGSAPWSESKILAGEVIRINTWADYPPEAAIEQNVRDIHEGMQSILLVPIRGAAGVIAGAVGFDSHAHPVKWSDEDVARCRMVGDAIATVMERMRAEEALRRSEEKFSKAFEASPSIMIIVRIKDRRCLEVNGAFEQHTGLRRTEVLGRPLPETVGHCDLRSFNHTFETVIEQGSIRNTEARLRNQGGESLIMLLSAETIEFDGQSCVLMVAEDITERIQAEDALRESEQRFRVMADSAPMMMWMSDTDTNCTDFNRAWCDFRGQTAEEESGQGWMEGIHPADLEKYVQLRRRAFGRQQRFTVEYRLQRHDGAYRWVSYTGVPRFLADGSVVGYIGCCIDIDDQKQAEITRTELSRRLMTAQEAERTRIARELHDGIGQSLALLGIQMQRAGQPVSGRPGRTSPGIPELCAKLKEIGNQVSRLSHQLHSSELEFLGPSVAVKGLCREFGEQYRIKVNCVCTGIPEELDDDVALCFLRVVQEALHNVAKHSRAQAVEVKFLGSSKELILSVVDDGIGFDQERVHNTAGLGMVSMRERMHLIGGDFAITSTPGVGTHIEARAPLSRGALSPDKRAAIAGK